MLNFKNISLRRGSKLLFYGASLTIHKGQKVGLTGANGVGKSSLFAFIRNELHPDEGDFSMPPGLEIAYVAQETDAVAKVAIEYVMDGDRELRQLQSRLENAERINDGLQQAELHTRLDDVDGYSARSRGSRLMKGLGFKTVQENTPVNEFSGGWRMRLNLAQALMCRSDLLLLDEPTNHLDLDAVIWLQDWLEKYPGTLLLVSHDRDFLNNIATHIIHIEQQRVELYTGNYSSFEKIRAEKLAQQQAMYTKQQQEVAHIQSFVDRFRAKATKAKQVQSRIKSLEKMALIALAHVDSPFDFSFSVPDKVPNPLLQVEQVNIGYDGKEILSQIDLSISPGDRIGLLGPNGAGKSSLIKVLAGVMPVMQGQRKIAEKLQVGYFAQHQLEQLHLDECPLWHVQQINRQATEKEIRNFLGGFNFQGDMVLDRVGSFSGGEKARLVLALLVMQNPNLLLLDEPTNHLDLEMRYALTVAMQDFQGAVIVVSHDRHLLRSVTDQLLLVADNRVQPFAGDLDDYRSWLAEQRNDSIQLPTEDKQVLSKKQQRRLEAEQRQKLKPLSDALTKAERQVDKLYQEQHVLEQQLADPDLYLEKGKQQLKKLLNQKVEIEGLLIRAEAIWMAANESLESAKGSLYG